MKWSGLHIPIIVISLLGGLLLFFGGQFLYNKYNVEKPLVELISNNSAVSNVEMQKNATGIKIEVDLKDTVTNIAEVHEELYQAASGILGQQPFKLEFEDNPDQELEQVWRQTQYYVHQAIMLGNFPEMAKNIQGLATAEDVQSLVYVTGSNIYIQLTKEDGHNLIKIVPRQNLMMTGQVAPGGGEAGVKRN